MIFGFKLMPTSSVNLINKHCILDFLNSRAASSVGGESE